MYHQQFDSHDESVGFEYEEDVQEVRRRGICGPELPHGSALCVTVPGAAALWEDTVKTFGKLNLKQVCTQSFPDLLQTAA